MKKQDCQGRTTKKKVNTYILHCVLMVFNIVKTHGVLMHLSFCKHGTSQKRQPRAWICMTYSLCPSRGAPACPPSRSLPACRVPSSRRQGAAEMTTTVTIGPVGIFNRATGRFTDASAHRAGQGHGRRGQSAKATARAGDQATEETATSRTRGHGDMDSLRRRRGGRELEQRFQKYSH